MKTSLKLAIVAALVVTVAAAVVLKQNQRKAVAEPGGVTMSAATNATSFSPEDAVILPKMVDVGAGKCVPCKMMKPILDDLKANYADHFVTQFIDVWENPDEGKKYGIEVIPTQIFYDAEGKELFRHTGFFGKEDILGKWKELGVDASVTPAAGK
jgi:thioredoxin 1